MNIVYSIVSAVLDKQHTYLMIDKIIEKYVPLLHSAQQIF